MKFNKREVSSGGTSEGGNLFLKIKDGDKVNGVCMGEIYEFRTLWDNGKSTVVTEGGKPRFRVNFIVYEDGKFVAKIWEFGVKVYNQLADLHDVYPLDVTKVRISRTGSTKDNTSYQVLPLVSDKDKLTPAKLKEIEAVELVSLKHQQGQSPGNTQSPSLKNYAPGATEF